MSARLSQRLREIREQGDAGMSLAELIVAMTLSVIVGAMTLMTVLGADTASGTSVDRSINASGARNALAAWTDYLRVADGTTAGSRLDRIEWLTAYDLLFHADLNNRDISTVQTTGAPTTVWLRRDAAGRLIEEQFPGTATVGAAPTVCRALVDGVTTTVPLFSALDSNATAISGLGTAPLTSSGASIPAGCQPLPAAAAPSRTSTPSVQTNLQNVYSVTIDFVLVDQRNAHPLEFRSQAVLPSMGGL